MFRDSHNMLLAHRHDDRQGDLVLLVLWSISINWLRRFGIGLRAEGVESAAAPSLTKVRMEANLTLKNSHSANAVVSIRAFSTGKIPRVFPSLTRRVGIRLRS